MFALCVQHYEDGWGTLWRCVGTHHTHDTSASLGHNVCSCRQVYHRVHASYHPEMKIQNPIYQPFSDHLPIQNLKMMMTVVEFQVESEVSSVRTKQVTTHLLAFNHTNKQTSETWILYFSLYKHKLQSMFRMLHNKSISTIEDF